VPAGTGGEVSAVTADRSWNPADPSWAQASRPAELVELVEQELDALRTGTGRRRWLAVAARFPFSSFENTLLVLAQRPASTCLAGRETWRALGRHVDPGEPPVALLSRTPGPAAGGAPRVVEMWDLAQTSGPALPYPPVPRLPPGAVPAGLWDALADVVAGAGFRLDRGPDGVDVDARLVRVGDDVDSPRAVRALAQALARIRLQDRGTRPGDLAAETAAVAFLVCAAHGLDPGGTGPPARTGGTDRDAVRRSGERVLAVARDVLAATETAVSPLDPAPVERERLRAVHAEAAWFFRRRLNRSWVPRYLHERGLDAALDAPWDAGRAPDGWTALVQHLRGQGVEDATLLACGLAQRARSGALVDTFRDRLTLPIRDDGGHVIGFVARARPDGDARGPKYLNSRTNAVYAKGRHLFGIHQNLPALRRGAVPVLVEGPLDAVAVTVACGGRAVGIAVCGSILTGAHLRHLARCVDLRDGVVVGFDTDPAGHHATATATALARARGIAARVADWAPEGDPAGVLRRHGPGEVVRRLAGPPP